MIDLELFKKILDPHPRIIDQNDFISSETIEFFSKYPPQKVAELFIKTSSKVPILFSWDHTCTKCGLKSVVQTSKSMLFEFIAGRGSICNSCNAKKLQDEKNERDAAVEKREIDRSEHTRRFISEFLNPNMSWVKGTIWKDALIHLQCAYRQSENGYIASAIKELPYYEFLKTPYWKCIAMEVYKRANFRCTLCSSNGSLRAHHPTYSFHGFEIEHIKDLVCLCADCHATFHQELEVCDVR